ncbi:hypothetical protein AAIH70_25595 [Neorhizobium sp. BT27B]|uniref:hypothetical protein n=1 Tax=Neorhizobium sp. BT27B TaxID=3142625 RepID=UPI003D29512E
MLIAYRALATAAFCLAYTLSFNLPKWSSYENGPIEITQNLVLVLGAVQAISYVVREKSPWRNLWAAAVPIWIICVGRELSWGAVFVPPADFAEIGPFYTSTSLPYKFLVAPAVGALLMASAFIFIRCKVWRLCRSMWSSGHLPLLETGMTGVALLLTTAAENNMGLTLQNYLGFSQIFEETVELAAYLFLLAAQQRIRAAELQAQSYP